MSETETGQVSEEAQELICPLLLLRSELPLAGSNEQSKCLHTRCAWWLPALERCAVRIAALNIYQDTTQLVSGPLRVRMASALVSADQALTNEGLPREQIEGILQPIREAVPKAIQEALG